MRLLSILFLLATSLPAQQRENLVLCMGISNMAGPNSALFLLGNPVTYRPTTRCWNPSSQQLEPYFGWNAQGFANSQLGRFGPDAGIAAILEFKYRNLVMVKLANPASPLIAGNHPTAPAFDPAVPQLWPSIVAEIRAVEAAVLAEGKVPHWVEMVWIGWETDGNRPAAYTATFESMVRQLRLLTRSPSLSVTVELPMRHPQSAWGQAGMESIQEQLADVDRRDPLLRVVDLTWANLTYRQDLVHRDSASSLLEGCLLGLEIVGIRVGAEVH